MQVARCSLLIANLTMKKALITGLTGQDGSYLAELLLQKGYEVYGLVRRTSTDPYERIEHIILDGGVKIIHGNLRDLSAVRRAMELCVPDEVYNLAAQSHVGISFECPEETMEIDYYGVGRVVNEAIRVNPKVKIYQASTSEMFGSRNPPQNETTEFDPISPYGEAKVKAYQDFIVNYRENHGVFACSGILFNHESPRRGKHFVTRKITHSLAKIKLGMQDVLELGNLESKRDWGYAGDYVEAMWLMMQQDKADDFVIGTGKSHSVREFVEFAAEALGMKIHWEGEGINTVGKDDSGKVIVKVNEKFYRPTDPHDLIADPSKAKRILNWEPKTSLKELVNMMTVSDFKELSKR